MFDSLYLLEDHSQSNNRFMVALVATIAFMGLSTTAMLGAERLRITRVEAPNASQHLLFMPTLPMAPEAKREIPPDAPKIERASAAASPSQDIDRHRDEPDADHSDQPDPDSKLPPKPGAGGPRVPGIPPNFQAGIGPGTGIGTCTVNCGPGRGTQTPPSGPRTPRIVKREQLNCVSCPDPSAEQIRRASRGSKHSGRNVTRFCVDENGRVEQVRTTKSIGDAQVDALIGTAVKRWRFRPFRIDGKAQRACTTATFNIEFR